MFLIEIILQRFLQDIQIKNIVSGSQLLQRLHQVRLDDRLAKYHQEYEKNKIHQRFKLVDM